MNSIDKELKQNDMRTIGQFKTMEILVQSQPSHFTPSYHLHDPRQPQINYNQQDYFLMEIQKILRTESNKKFYNNKVVDIPILKLENYHDAGSIRKNFSSCYSLNDEDVDFSALDKAEFFVLRSTCDDDIHKAIKYGIWTSTQNTNNLLNRTLQNCQRRGVPLFLIYTVVNSGQFCGIAQMIKEVNHFQIFNYWWEDLKWSGIFPLKWIYVKDIPHSEVKHILSKGIPLSGLKDGEAVEFEAGKKILDVFKNKRLGSNIFDAFDFMDSREEKLRVKRDSYYETLCLLKDNGYIIQKQKQSSRKVPKNNGEPKQGNREKGFKRNNYKSKNEPEHYKSGYPKKSFYTKRREQTNDQQRNPSDSNRE